MSDEQDLAPPGIDVTVPSIARVYDHVLGGRDNFAADRAVTRSVAELLPEVPETARDCRAFLRRAVRWLVADAGVRQIVDLGSGLPTAGNVHEVAQAVVSGVRVVYVDNDPIVLVHGRALLADDASTTVIQADVRSPDAIFEHPDVRAMIDLDAPFAVIVSGVLHHLADDEDPSGVVAAIRGWMSSGSYLVVANFFDPGDDVRVPAVQSTFQGRLGTGRFRTRAEQEHWFDDLEMVEPGLVFVNDWKPDLHTPRASPMHRLVAGAVARKR